VNGLRELRVSRGLSQQAVAVLAHVSPALLVAIERYDYRPTAPVQQRIAAVLKCSPSEIWLEVKPDAT
jgi:DNA-binding XRE family transcriptional regulator